MEKRIDSLLATLSLEQKASLCSGADFWHLKGIEELGIPSIMVSDGPNGLRKQQAAADHVGLNDSLPATCFPSLSALGCSWDTDLAQRIGIALGEECRQEKVAVILGPGLNIKRSALCGRNFEYLSEDPHLTGQMATALVRGVQSQGIGTSPKHYAVNNQETRRMSVNTVVDDRALREIYLAGFEAVVSCAQPMTLMTAYNQVNGHFCSENRFLIHEVLKTEWGFDGLAVTDWGGSNDRVAGLSAGQDLEMPGSAWGNERKIVEAVRDGRLALPILDAAVARILKVILATATVLSPDFHYDANAHQRLAREAAAASAVLLKNNGVLPLQPGQTVAIIGKFAKEPRYQGSGSSKVKPSQLENAWDAFQAAVPHAAIVGYSDGTDPAAAARLAARADLALVFAGLPEQFESEGFDRSHLDMPANHHDLISMVARANPRTAVILSNGAPLLMPWLDSVAAVLETYLGGQAWGPAVADLITGQTNPSGRLAETFPAALDDEPSRPNFPGGTVSVAYAESVYVGYRYYESAARPVLFPFGHGLSYTSFAWSDLRVIGTPSADEVQLSLKVRNTGDRAGSETVQIYVHDVATTVFRPVQELKAFAKVQLRPGETQEVRLVLGRRAFAFWDTGAKTWVVESGEFELRAGASSADIRLKTSVQLASSDRLSAWATALASQVPEYFHPDQSAFRDLSASGPFARLLGRELPPRNRHPGAPHTKLSTIQDIQDRLAGRLFYWGIKLVMKKMFGPETDPETRAMLDAMVKEMPLRNLGMMSQGAISEKAADGLVLVLNGHLLKGIVKIIKG